MSKRQIKLGAFIPTTSQHVAGWRHPESRPQDHLNIDYVIELALTAERGLFDAYFLADGLSVRWGSAIEGEKGLGDKGVGFEPVTLFAALSTVTKNIGFIATASTTYEDPYILARKFASLDHISKGRAAWNVVTTASADTARNFGLEKHPDAKVRYERADEFIEVTQKLWDSWEDDTFIYTKEDGQFFDARLSGLAGGIDLEQYDIDEPFPELDESLINFGSRQQMMIDIARKHNFTIRQLYEYVASARGHWTLVGTPEQIVNQLQEWFENEAADGFNILPPSTPAGLNDFVDLIVPELQRRGLFRTEYEGSTLRENLGLKRPENQYVLAQHNTAAAS
jgi:alkanesulfonate monooxygenase SsuD/methylene tetrahydromethanopterin reductase-like flavin-dependent oxidoreductase (luciferase family)